MAPPAAGAEAWKEALLTDGGMGRPAGGPLTMAGVSLAAVAEEFGSPTFVYNLDVLRSRHAALLSAFASQGVPLRIRYAVKANGSRAILETLASLGAGADIVSGGEMAAARRAGIPAGRIVYSGVGKTEDELGEAVRADLGAIHVESLQEMDLLARVAAREGRDVAVGIRVNPGVTTETHPYISTGQAGIKFGIPADQVRAAAEQVAASPRLTLHTLGMHLGSQLLVPAPYGDGLACLLGLLDQLKAHHLAEDLQVIDLGGGIGMRFRDEIPLDPRELAAAVAPGVRKSGLAVQMEPGRSLVGPAGILLTRVLYRKHSGGKDFLVVDAGMNDLARPSLYQAYHHMIPVDPVSGPVGPTDVVGPVCETGDWLARDRGLPAVPVGALLVVLGAGAYAYSMGSNYNLRRRPAEVVVAGGRSALARSRETVDDLFRRELPDPLSLLSPDRGPS